MTGLRAGPHALWSTLAAALLLAACGSTPLPKLPPLVPSRTAAPAAPVAASGPVAATAPAAPASAPAPVSITPWETPAVAARFPEPAEPVFIEWTPAAALQDRLAALAAPRPAAATDGLSSITLLTLGKSQEGAPLQALLFTRQASPTPAVIVRGGRPTVLLVAQQHGDEPAGAEALLAVADALASGPLQALLDRINVILVPRANPDGASHAVAALASGADLDTDHLLLASPEARALAQLARDYRPQVVVDVREYPLDPGYAERFGGVQRADLQLQYAGSAGLPEFLAKASEEWFRAPLLAALKTDGYTHEWAHRADLANRRLSMGTARPDALRNASGLRNAVAFTLESRGGNLGPVHAGRRIASHVAAVSSLLRSSAQRADDLVKLRKYVDHAVTANLCTGELVLDPRLTPAEHSLVLLDPQTGADRTAAVAWESSLALRDGQVRSRPCGYWLAAGQGNALDRLRALGLRIEQLSDAVEMQGDANGGTPVAGERELISFNAPAGSYYVPLSQPWGNLAAAVLEPDAARGFLAGKLIASPSRLAKVMVVPKVRRTLVP